MEGDGWVGWEVGTRWLVDGLNGSGEEKSPIRVSTYLRMKIDTCSQVQLLQVAFP